MTKRTQTPDGGEILIVDDKQENLTLLAGMLIPAGYRVRQMRKPEEALASAFENPPDLALVAAKMPRTDGFKLCRRLKENRRTASVPIIFIGVPKDEGDRLCALEAGGADFFDPPFQERIVLARVAIQLRLAHTNRELQRFEELARTLLNATNDMAHLIDEDGTILDLNDAMADALGTRREKLIGTCVFDKFPDDVAERRRELVRRVVRERKPVRFVDEGRSKGKLFDSSIYPVAAPGRKPQVVVFARDITERRRAEEALAESEARFRDTFEQAAVGIVHVSFEGRFLRVNRKFCDIVGYSREEILQRTFQEITWPEDLQAEMEQAGRLLSGKISTYSMDTRYVRKDGTLVWINLNGSLMRDEKGEPLCFVAVVEDISERKKAEEALRRSRDYLRHLTDSIPDAVFSVKMPERVIEWINDSYDVLGYEPKECIGETAGMLYRDAAEHRSFGDMLARAVQAGKRLLRTEALLRRKNGEVFPAEITAALYREEGEVVSVTALVKDITERRRAEKELLQHRRRLKELAAQLILTEERERRRIAVDLHDQIGQTLALARVQLSGLRRKIADRTQTGAIDEISTALLQASRDTRRLIFSLSPPALSELGLAPAIAEWLEEEIEKRHGLKTKLETMGRVKKLDGDVQRLLFRNVRELLTNVAKHARSSMVTVRLEQDETQVRIIVRDDGCGFDYDPEAIRANSEGGFGLFSIHERMADLGGNLEIQSAPGNGCTATLRMPLEKGKEPRPEAPRERRGER